MDASAIGPKRLDIRNDGFEVIADGYEKVMLFDMPALGFATQQEHHELRFQYLGVLIIFCFGN